MQRQTKKVTILVQVLDQEQIMHRRLASIYNQTYKNYEVIFLDTESSKRGTLICQEYLNKYPDCTRLVNVKVGDSDTFELWKQGIELAKGEFCWITKGCGYADADFLKNPDTKFK